MMNFEKTEIKVEITEQQKEDLLSYVRNDICNFDIDDYELTEDPKNTEGLVEMKRKVEELTTFPSRWIFPNFKDEDITYGKWSLRQPNGSPMIGEVEYMIDELVVLGIGSLWDWTIVYVEKSFCDNDGACIWLNINPDSQLYERMLVEETFDEIAWTLLDKKITILKAMELSREFKSEIDIDDGDSKDCKDCYFVSWIADKYNARSCSAFGELYGNNQWDD